MKLIKLAMSKASLISCCAFRQMLQQRLYWHNVCWIIWAFCCHFNNYIQLDGVIFNLYHILTQIYIIDKFAEIIIAYDKLKIPILVNYIIHYIGQQMDVLQLRLKFMIDWIITKKASISALSRNHLPIYKAIKQFIQSYIKNINQIAIMAEKIMKDLRISENQGNNQVLIELFDLIRQKQLLNAKEWQQKLQAVQNKYNGKVTQNKKFPDIFKQLDINIQYYSQLKTKLKGVIIKKQKNINSANYPPYDYKHKSNQIFKTYAEKQKLKNEHIQMIEKTRTDAYAYLYDKQYGDVKYPNQKYLKNQANKSYESPSRQAGKIKPNTYMQSIKSTDKSTEYSPYKSVNPRFSPKKNSKQYYSERQNFSNSQDEFRRRDRAMTDNFLSSADDKYQNYKYQLYENMKKHTKKQKQYSRQLPKYTTNMYLNQRAETPKRKYNLDEKFKQYSSANTEKYQYKYQLQNNANKNYTITPKSIKGNGKKYKYLNEQENNYTQPNQFTDDEPINRDIFMTFGQRKPNSKFQRQTNHASYSSKRNNNDDSLQKHDKLVDELEIDMPNVFNEKKQINYDNASDLQQILAESLMSSKKWDEQSEKDSLDQENNKRSSGKFKQISYSDQDDEINPKNIKQKPLYFQSKLSSQSKQLVMSFGRD